MRKGKRKAQKLQKANKKIKAALIKRLEKELREKQK